jgi:hypothetical protein
MRKEHDVASRRILAFAHACEGCRVLSNLPCETHEQRREFCQSLSLYDCFHSLDIFTEADRCSIRPLWLTSVANIVTAILRGKNCDILRQLLLPVNGEHPLSPHRIPDVYFDLVAWCTENMEAVRLTFQANVFTSIQREKATSYFSICMMNGNFETAELLYDSGRLSLSSTDFLASLCRRMPHPSSLRGRPIGEWTQQKVTSIDRAHERPSSHVVSIFEKAAADPAVNLLANDGHALSAALQCTSSESGYVGRRLLDIYDAQVDKKEAQLPPDNSLRVLCEANYECHTNEFAELVERLLQFPNAEKMANIALSATFISQTTCRTLATHPVCVGRAFQAAAATRANLMHCDRNARIFNSTRILQEASDNMTVALAFGLREEMSCVDIEDTNDAEDAQAVLRLAVHNKVRLCVDAFSSELEDILDDLPLDVIRFVILPTL